MVLLRWPTPSVTRCARDTLRLLAREVAADAAFPEAQGGRLERKGEMHIPIHLMCSGNILNVPLSSRKAFEP